MTDDEREIAIDREYFNLIGAKSPAARRAAWEKMRRLVLARSEQQQTKMALDRNLPVRAQGRSSK